MNVLRHDVVRTLEESETRQLLARLVLQTAVVRNWQLQTTPVLASEAGQGAPQYPKVVERPLEAQPKEQLVDLQMVRDTAATLDTRRRYHVRGPTQPRNI
ncbi:hypothetical protein F1559_001745 [Cyanidiococcus yangmingshanensis]|uniref:Uncharacterized protein n=1 Tax=Cyanidiococcus yangmingshanensis TaxID=2690220 RepID=A0A7J7ILV6_9RHOD|nr:hypothetical protein F1559_001745 [Cyanidiococcus yangmingshanensis]